MAFCPASSADADYAEAVFPSGFACQSAAERGRLAKAKKNPAGEIGGWIDSWRFARLHLLTQITPWQSSPPGSLGCAAAERGRLAKAKKNPARAGFFEDWWSLSNSPNNFISFGVLGSIFE